MRPLEGIRLVWLGTGINGPFAQQYLAGLGAESIRVQAASRLRNEGGGALPFSPQAGFVVDYPSIGRISAGAGYLGLGLELKHPKGLEIFKRLVKKTDVVLISYAGDVATNLGIDYESLKKVKEDIIVIEMPSMGTTGPYRDYSLFGFNITPMTGLTRVIGYPDLPEPEGTAAGGSTLTDFLGGYLGAVSILFALEYRNRTGKGQHIDQALMELTVNAMGPTVLDHVANGAVAGPMGNRDPHAAPHGVYRCKGEDRWCAISVFTEEEWQGFCRAIDPSGKDSLASDPRFATLEDRLKNQDELDKVVEEFTSSRDTYEVMYMMQHEGVSAGVVQNSDDIIQRDVHLNARDFWVRLPNEKRGMAWTYGVPVKMSKTPPKLSRGHAVLGQDNDYILKDIVGMGDEEIAKLTEEGAICKQIPGDPSWMNRSLNGRWTGRLGSSLPRASQLKWID